jgi:hypothetical protein
MSGGTIRPPSCWFYAPFRGAFGWPRTRAGAAGQPQLLSLLDQLPEGTKPPLVQKFDLDAIWSRKKEIAGYR